MGIAVALPASGTAIGQAQNAVDLLVDQAAEAAQAGIDGVWFAQQFSVDAITVAALAGRAVPGIEVGTSVVPIYPRHPLVLAQQAQTAQAAAGGRFTLGVGLGAQRFVEEVFGTPVDRPIRHLRDYLKVLRSVFQTGTAALHAPTLTADLTAAPLSTQVPGAQPPVPIIVAAMGPQALRATGELADGTLPLLVGPDALAEQITVPITAAATAAGRPAPRIIAGMHAVVTADPAAVRETAQRLMSFYATVPSYRRVLDLQGIEDPVQLAAIGDEQTVAATIDRYFEAGATDVLISQAGMHSDEERRLTWRLAGDLARDRARR
jgi:F420-dependent oxidoreductase-like protein